MSLVAVLRCNGYDEALVGQTVRKGIDMLGGPAAFAKSGEKILLKPNWLAPDPPEKCTCTHPMVFKAVCEAFLETGAKLWYGDSPAFQRPDAAANKSGCAGVADGLSIPLADFRHGKEIFHAHGIQNKKFTIANGVLESDGVISLPKLKSHGFLRMTGAVKNQFGCIPGALKGEFHVKTSDPTDFSRMLADLNAFIKPRLYIMDGIIAMEGNGPRGGTPKALSTDPVALDAAACRIISIDPRCVPTIKAGEDAGIGGALFELIGDPIEGFIDTTFAIKREPIAAYRPKGALIFAKNALVPRPVIVAKKCIKCGVCVTVCPVNPKALDWHDNNKNRPPSYMYKRCIRCYCCQELCPQSAIRLKVPFLRKFFMKNKRSMKGNSLKTP
jgi:uncharacterized protein (DUF362 family)/Pyruvate/2-oxoacid:ferredoxin oxidoreductase delta subunit